MGKGKMNKRQERLREMLLEKKRVMWNELRDDLFRTTGEGLQSQFEIALDPAEQGLIDVLADTGLPPERVLIDPLTGGLGYGLEYTYSIVERIRLVRSGPDTTYATATTADLDVCGVVRRYKGFAGGPGSLFTWVDVTSLYPASSLNPAREAAAAPTNALPVSWPMLPKRATAPWAVERSVGLASLSMI